MGSLDSGQILSHWEARQQPIIVCKVLNCAGDHNIKREASRSMRAGVVRGGFLDKTQLALLAFSICSSVTQKFVLGLLKVLREILTGNETLVFGSRGGRVLRLVTSPWVPVSLLMPYIPGPWFPLL